MSSKNIIKCMEKINKTTSNKEKEKILKEHDCKELREYLNISLNPYKIYYVSKFPTEYVGDKETVFIPYKGFSRFEELVRYLEERKITGYLALNTIVKVFDSFTNKESEWYAKAITKKSIGVGVTTTNKVYGDIIPRFKVMLADSNQPDLDKLVYPLIVQPKVDGFRAVYIPGKGLVGRNGKIIRNTNIPKHFGELFTIRDFVFDGELYSDDIGFNDIASILNSTDKEIPPHIHYTLFDGMEEQDWKQQSCKLGYFDRLCEIVKRIENNTVREGKDKNIYSLSCEHVTDLETLKDRYRGFIEEGYEGAMLKDPNGLYQWKRVRCSSQTMMKLKPEITHDLEITGFEEGEGKLEGSLGKLIVDFNSVEVGVGSGLTEELRDSIWKDQKGYKGRIVEVKAMEITPDLSLRHPVFIRFREDKDE